MSESLATSKQIFLLKRYKELPEYSEFFKSIDDINLLSRDRARTLISMLFDFKPSVANVDYSKAINEYFDSIFLNIDISTISVARFHVINGRGFISFEDMLRQYYPNYFEQLKPLREVFRDFYNMFETYYRRINNEATIFEKSESMIAVFSIFLTRIVLPITKIN